MDAKLRTCSVCRKTYKYCLKCREYEYLPTWMFAFCSENCKDIYNITSDYEDKRVTADEAKKQLDKLDLSRISNFGTSYQNTINDINKKSTSVKIAKSIKKDEQPKNGVENNYFKKAKTQKVKSDNDVE
nr:MAG TPA: DNA gyrase subunit A [Caudoviricetes sp.]